VPPPPAKKPSTSPTKTKTTEKSEVEDNFLGTGMAQETVLAGGTGILGLIAVLLL
jgi:hypothetical protein